MTMEQELEMDSTLRNTREALDEAQQELKGIEIRKSEGSHIRAAARWWQFRDRMSKEFFLQVKERPLAAAIQALVADSGEMYDTTETVCDHASSFYETLFQASEVAQDTLHARQKCWKHVPPLISRSQNVELFEDLTSFELFNTLAELPKEKAPGSDGFPAKFFVTMWDAIDSDILALYQKTLEEGSLDFNLNT